jgi:hypothetical protein
MSSRVELIDKTILILIELIYGESVMPPIAYIRASLSLRHALHCDYNKRDRPMTWASCATHHILAISTIYRTIACLALTLFCRCTEYGYLYVNTRGYREG